MTAYVALLRAVNVGGRKLAMTDLRAIAQDAGLESPRTFIASGNLLFTSTKDEAVVARLLEDRLSRHMGGEVPVFIRTARQMADVAKGNPFANEPGSRVAAIFLEKAPATDLLENARGIADEELALGRREIYVHYPGGMGRSKLRWPGTVIGTARNMNTVGKLAELAKEAE
jgi:uncharacterized protein (DUF1697 family)